MPAAIALQSQDSAGRYARSLFPDTLFNSGQQETSIEFPAALLLASTEDRLRHAGEQPGATSDRHDHVSYDHISGISRPRCKSCYGRILMMATLTSVSLPRSQEAVYARCNDGSANTTCVTLSSFTSSRSSAQRNCWQITIYERSMLPTQSVTRIPPTSRVHSDAS